MTRLDELERHSRGLASRKTLAKLHPDVDERRRIPAAVRLSVTAFFVLWFPIWWIHQGWANFLWFSDLALIAASVCVWYPRPLLASTAAVGVLIPEALWNAGFFGQLLGEFSALGLADYMFDAGIPWFIRVLSGTFHILLPPLLIYLVWQLGYEPKAWRVMTVVAWIVLPLSRWAATPETNLNWTYGVGGDGSLALPPMLHVAGLMLAFPLLIYLPTHWLLQRLPAAHAAR